VEVKQSAVMVQLVVMVANKEAHKEAHNRTNDGEAVFIPGIRSILVIFGGLELDHS
jgi:hypothetical protein